MPSALAVGTKKTLNAVQGTYKSIFSKEYLGNATEMAKVHKTSKGKFVFGRVLIAVGLTAGAPIVLPVAIARGIYKATKAENARRNPTFVQSSTPPSPPPVVTPVVLATPETSPFPDPSTASLQETARKLLISRGVSEQAAAEMAAYVYRPIPPGATSLDDLPNFSEEDLLALSKILEQDPTFSLSDLDKIED